MTGEPSFEAFVTAHHPSVVRALTLALGDRGRAEDMAQEAFARAFQHWERVAEMDRPLAWIYVVGVNAGRRAFRHQADVAPVVDTIEHDHANRVVVAATIQVALARLTGRQRLAVVLRHLADLSTAEVAEAMGCAEGTVKSTLHAALRVLRVDLDEEEM